MGGGNSMKIQIEVDTDNAAFEDDPEELFRVLAVAAEQSYNIVHGRETSGVLRDINGNTVGHVHIGDSVLERDAIAQKARQEEKRKWFKKTQTNEFWESLWEGVDGEEGREYMMNVYHAIYDILGERG